MCLVVIRISQTDITACLDCGLFIDFVFLQASCLLYMQLCVASCLIYRADDKRCVDYCTCSFDRVDDDVILLHGSVPPKMLLTLYSFVLGGASGAIGVFSSFLNSCIASCLI